MVKAVQAARHNRGKALQWLVTHSFSGHALAVRRVTENKSRNTPRVDKVTWKTPAAKANAIASLKGRGYLYISEPGQKKRLDIDRYKFLVHQLLRNMLEAGDVYGEDSTEYRRFEDDLISNVRWEQKDALLRDIGAPVLLAPIEQTLAMFHDARDAGFRRVNERIDRGENAHIKLTRRKGERRWTLLYSEVDETVNGSFYGQLPGVRIANLLWFVAGRTGFLKAFTHVLERNVRQDADPREILACVVAMGTNMGLRRMAEVSGLSYASLLNTARNYLRPETLHSGNEAISNATAGRSSACSTSATKSIRAAMANVSKRRSIRSTHVTHRNTSALTRASAPIRLSSTTYRPIQTSSARTAQIRSITLRCSRSVTCLHRAIAIRTNRPAGWSHATHRHITARTG